MAPLMMELQKHHKRIQNIICVTGQHRALLDQVLKYFQIQPDYDLDIMMNRQSLVDLSIRGLKRIKVILRKEKPDLIIVQGDTTTTFIASLSATYFKIPVAHIEAGLRTHAVEPFPEELNRKLCSVIADYHFAPTIQAKLNLMREGIPEKRIYVTGNTIVDAVLRMKNHVLQSDKFKREICHFFLSEYKLDLTKIHPLKKNTKKILLVTSHRRENWGNGIKNICLALKKVLNLDPELHIVYCLHLNPKARNLVIETLSDKKNIHLIPPLEYPYFLYLMQQSAVIISDSGGIQEEAPIMGKPLIITRNCSERPECITDSNGKSIIIGTKPDDILEAVECFLKDLGEPKIQSEFSYGDGKASVRIATMIEHEILPTLQIPHN